MSCATTILKNPENAIAEIDRVLNGTSNQEESLREKTLRLPSQQT